jgi:hypothetical protein
MTHRERIDDAVAFQRKHGWDEADRLIRLCMLDERAHIMARNIIRFERILLGLRPEYV